MGEPAQGSRLSHNAHPTAVAESLPTRKGKDPPTIPGDGARGKSGSVEPKHPPYSSWGESQLPAGVDAEAALPSCNCASLRTGSRLLCLRDSVPMLALESGSILRKTASAWHLYLVTGTAYLALAVLWTFPVWLSSDRLIGLPGDPVSYAWGAAWVPYALTHGLNPYFTHYLNAPAGINYMWPAPVLIYDLIAWPLTVLVSPTLGYNVIILLGLVTTGLATLTLFRRLSNRPWLVVLASAMFTFGPYMAAETIAGHPDLVAVAGIPLLALCLHELFVRQQWSVRRLGVMLGVVTVAQMVTSEEVLASSILVFSIGIGLHLWASHGLVGRSRKYVVSVLKWGALFTPILLGYAAYQWFEPGALHGLNASPAIYGAPPVSFFVPGNAQLLTTVASSELIRFVWRGGEELGSYVGVPLALLLLWVVRRKLSPKVKWLLGMTIACMILSLGPYLTLRGGTRLFTPEYLVTLVPVLRDLLPIRLSVYVDLFLAALVLVVVDGLEWSRLRRGLVLGILLLAWMPAVPVPSVSIPIPRFFSAHLAGSIVRPNATVLVLPYVLDGATDEAMLWQAAGGLPFRMPEGYWVRLSVGQRGNRYGPPIDRFNASLYEVAQTGRPGRLTNGLEHDGLLYLRHHDVQAVILGPTQHELQLKRYVEALLSGSRPIAVGGVLVWKVASDG